MSFKHDFGLSPKHNKSNDEKESKKIVRYAQNNRTFVYKIIHDLRHPTEALSAGLKNILSQYMGEDAILQK